MHNNKSKSLVVLVKALPIHMQMVNIGFYKHDSDRPVEN